VSGNDIYVMPALTGGAPRRTIEGVATQIAATHAWSRDGSQIVFATDSGIAIRAVAGGTVRYIVRGVFLHSPSLSANGRLLAYAFGRRPTFENVSTNSVWTVPVEGGTPVRVSDSTHVNVSPVWMPDGKSLLFISNAGGSRDVYEQRVDTHGRPVDVPARLTTALGAFVISLSADGSRMAYDAVRNFSNIFAVDIGASPARMKDGRQITKDNQHIESVALSHDHRWLAYDSDRAGNFDIYKLRLDGTSDPVPLTTNPANDFAPVWSPDDQLLAFHTARNGTRDIYTVRAEGTDEAQVTSGPEQDFFPSWSPDGKRLAYSSETGTEFVYYIIDRRADGGWTPRRRLAAVGDLRTSSQDWSPDGNWIVFNTSTTLSIIAPDGSGLRVLADSATLKGRPAAPIWMPDGSEVLAYAGTQAGIGAIWRVPLAGGPPRQVLTSDGSARFGRWIFATDGRTIYYTRAAWERDVWVMDLKR
jgi:TolB protein